MNDNNYVSVEKINIFLKELMTSEYKELLTDVDPIPSLALKMASNVLVFNSKMYVECNMRQLNISGLFAKLVSEKAYNKISNPLLSLLTKILILDTDNEE